MKDYVNKSIAANYIKGIKSIGGNIYFDKTGLIFRSHNLNVQIGEIRFEYFQIQQVTKRNTWVSLQMA